MGGRGRRSGAVSTFVNAHVTQTTAATTDSGGSPSKWVWVLIALGAVGVSVAIFTAGQRRGRSKSAVSPPAPDEAEIHSAENAPTRDSVTRAGLGRVNRAQRVPIAVLCPERASAFCGSAAERSPIVADDASLSASYGQCSIIDQPNTDTEQEPCAAVSLTPAEARILSLLPTYRTLAAIGSQLGIGRPTVKTHVENIYRKLGATNRAEAVNLAETAGPLPHR